jgi:integrase
MNMTRSRKAEKQDTWPRKVQPGREVVNVYRRLTPSGNFAFMVANYAEGKRRFDAYSSEADALAAADKLAKLIDKRAYKAASITEEQATEYATAAIALAPFKLTVGEGVGALAECLKIVADLSNLHAAVKFYKERHKTVTKKLVAEVVAELLKVKASRGASDRYHADLASRLNRFARDCTKDCCNVTASDIQAWLDAQKADGKAPSPQTYKNFRTVLGTLFQFAVARGYAADNPIEGVEKLKVRTGEVEIYKPGEIARLLEAARANYPDFMPSLAIGAFAGLRSAEIERLEWKDIDFASRHIVVSAGNSKTASRRIVPLCDNLTEWLAPYSGRQQGKVWPGASILFYKRQQQIALATAVEADEEKGVKAQKPVEWKGNALRHSYASYRFALTGDAGRVAGECGNSAAVIHRHYRELVKPADAERWFNVKPEGEASNVLPLAVASA